MAKYVVNIGKSIEVNSFDVGDIAEVKQLSKIFLSLDEARAKRHLSYVLLTGIFSALMISFLVSLFKESYHTLEVTWMIVAVPLALILRSHFGHD